jgi:hypothetical protein
MSCAVTDAPLSLVVTSWPTRVIAGDSGRYSSENLDHISVGLISVPVSSVIVWMARENSICSRLGRSKPCSAYIMKATPPLPDWLLTRITAS